MLGLPASSEISEGAGFGRKIKPAAEVLVCGEEDIAQPSCNLPGGNFRAGACVRSWGERGRSVYVERRQCRTPGDAFVVHSFTEDATRNDQLCKPY